MKTYLVIICIAGFLTMSCASDNGPERAMCKVAIAYFGNDIPPDPPTRDYKYEYFYENKMVSKIIASGINGENAFTHTYEFDAKERPFRAIFGVGEQEEEHVLYTYSSNSLKVTTIRIRNGTDTLSTFSANFFYVENPADKVYHFVDGRLKTSYKFKDGNVTEYGNFDIVDNDTVDTFYRRYFYDDRPNTFYVPDYHVAVYPDFFVATITSKNNAIQLDNFGSDPPFTVDADYEYDMDGKLVRYKGGTGNTVEFEYECR